MAILRHCPICSSSEGKILFTRDFSAIKDVAPFEKYDVIVCEKCGFVYARPYGEYNLLDYYETESKYDNQEYGKYNEVYRKIFNMFNCLCEEGNIFTDKKKFDLSILDIGCSMGMLLYIFKENGYKNLTGLEPSSQCRELANKIYGIDIITGAAKDTLPRKYDLIISTTVLEHLLSLREEVHNFKEKLNKDGVCFLVVPNAEFFCTRDNLFQDFSTEHINYFNIESLDKLMEITGMERIVMHDEGEFIYALYKKNDNVNSHGYNKNVKLEICLQKYIQNSTKVLAHINGILEKYKNKKLLVWGTGTHTATLLGLSVLKNMKISGFVDSNRHYWGKKINGIKIISPDELLEDEKLSSESILISSELAQTDIKKYIIDDLKLKNEIITLY
ncbi:class I SAM-dependent methyltransferase [Pectinatus frisingensis]|uniref:class I SAM-dependent methyltransferase n=1 Tax=Pectinatus frisingensis TaxID=865 RepID=UPI0018C4A768|nr:class I SAM-dependent methyltransferase [Pectinatus frisingensis]